MTPNAKPTAHASRGRTRAGTHPHAGASGSALQSMGKAILWGFLLGCAILFLLTFVLAWAALQLAKTQGTPLQSLSFPVALIAIFLCGYGGALMGAKRTVSAGGNAWLGGMAVGGALLLLWLLVSLFFPAASGTERTALQRFAPPLVLLIAAALGSLTAAMHRPSQKRQLKKLTAGKRR